MLTCCVCRTILVVRLLLISLPRWTHQCLRKMLLLASVSRGTMKSAPWFQSLVELQIKCNSWRRSVRLTYRELVLPYVFPAVSLSSSRSKARLPTPRAYAPWISHLSLFVLLVLRFVNTYFQPAFTFLRCCCSESETTRGIPLSRSHNPIWSLLGGWALHEDEGLYGHLQVLYRQVRHFRAKSPPAERR